MKKMYILIFSFLLLLPFTVFAESCDTNNVVIKNIEQINKSEGTNEKTEATIENNKINLDISMSDVDDYIEYQFNVENKSDEELVFNEKSITSEDDHFTYHFTYEDNSNIIPAHDDKDVTMTITYTREIDESEFENGTYQLEETNKLNVMDSKLVNPKTANYFTMVFTFILGVIAIAGLFIIKNKYMKALLLLCCFIPSTVYALCSYEIEININIEVSNIQPKCIRATTLHTETCSNTSTSYDCQAAGYASGATITYGNQTTTSGVLATGDAFDCDVNGDGEYDASAERFYYVSDYYDASTTSFDNNVAVLIYYSNVRGGVANTQRTSYATKTDCQSIGTCTDSNGCNWYGPITAREQLPTTSQWSNVSLYKETRPILGDSNETSTSGGTLPTAFSYTGYAARLLTYQEAYQGCNSYSENNKYPTDTGGLSSKCQFLMEMTKFSNGSNPTYGPWLETPVSWFSSTVWEVNANDRSLMGSNSGSTSNGARPTIDVLKSDILY